MVNWGKVVLLHPLRVYKHLQADIWKGRKKFSFKNYKIFQLVNFFPSQQFCNFLTRLSIIIVNWEISYCQQVITLCMRIQAIATKFCPRGLLGVALLLFCLLFIYLASIRQIIRLSSVGPLCLIFLCLFGPLPSSFAMLPNRTRNSSPTAASAPALVSGTLASTSISPEFLVLVIQAI